MNRSTRDDRIINIPNSNTRGIISTYTDVDEEGPRISQKFVIERTEENGQTILQEVDEYEFYVRMSSR